MFIILSGSSGVGKNTVIKEMQKTKKDLVLMPTFTTREKREGEVEGMPYFYITKNDFQDKIRENELIEYEFIHNNYYGSSFKVFDEYIKSGKIIIKDIGVEGAQNLCIKMKEHTDMIKVFLAIPHKNELKKRLKGRGEKQIALRLKRFDYEQKQKYKFDYIINNINLQETSEYVKKIITATQKDFFFNKPIQKLNSYKIKYYINKLTSGKILRPVKIAIYEDKIVVLSKPEKLVASFICKIPVAKLIVNKKVDSNKFIYNYIMENAEQQN